MQRNEPVLDVHARAHLLCAAHEDAHLAGADFGKQLFFSCVGVGVVNESDLAGRNPPCDELIPNVLLDGKGRVRLYVQEIVQGMKLRAARCLVPGSPRRLFLFCGGFSFGGGQVTE